MWLAPRFRRWLEMFLIASVCVFVAPVVWADGRTRTHRVAKGQTLGAIARRYQVTVEDLCRANGIRRRDPIRPGQGLVIPDDKGENGDDARRGATSAGVERRQPPVDTSMMGRQQTLEVPGCPPAYYYEPGGRGRLALRPVIMVLHGRGASPSDFCARWAPVARSAGWLVCPSGSDDRGGGRAWSNDWSSGRHIVNATLKALRKKYGRRVRLSGNTLVGFSEGAFVAMNVGVRDAWAFNRWLILAADDDYWGAAAPNLLDRARGRVRRVYLITGKEDSVHDGTLETRRLLRQARIPVRLSHPEDMGHTVSLEGKRAMYRAALEWVND